MLNCALSRLGLPSFRNGVLVCLVWCAFHLVPCQAQCPTWNNQFVLAYQQGCTYTFYVVPTYTNGTRNVRSIDWTYEVTGEVAAIDAHFIRADNALHLQGGQLAVADNKVRITYDEPELGLNKAAFEASWVAIVITAKDSSTFTLSRSANSILQTTQPCGRPQACAPITIKTQRHIIDGLVAAPSASLSACPNRDLGIAGATIAISGPGMSCQTKTTDEGQYKCQVCYASYPYTLCALDTCATPCGVSNSDLLAMQSYLLQDETTAEQNYTIDANRDGRANEDDLKEIQQYLLNKPHNITNWCRFLPVRGYLPFRRDADSCITINEFWGARDFIRFTIGDFDGSCHDCVHGDGSGDIKKNIGRPKKPIKLVQHDHKLSLSFLSPDRLYAFATKFHIPEGTTVTDVQSDLPNLEYDLQDHMLSIIWLPTNNELGYPCHDMTTILNVAYKGDEAPALLGNEHYAIGADYLVKKIVPQ